MRRISRLLLLAMIGSLGLSGCRGREQSNFFSSAAKLASTSGCALPAGQQEVLLAAGQNPYNASLYRLNLCTLESHRIAGTERTSSVATGGKGIVVVSKARDGVDSLCLLQDNKLVAVPGLGRPAALAPTVSALGQIGYVTLGDTDRDAYLVHVWTPGSSTQPGSDRIVYRSRTETPTIVTGWTPEGSTVVSETPESDYKSSGPARLVVLDGKGGVTKRVQLDLPLAGPFLWSANGLVAVGETDSAGTVRSGRVLRADDYSVVGTLPLGWMLLALSADRRQLLLSKNGELATADATQAAPLLTVIGETQLGTIISAGWPTTDRSPT